MTHASPPERLAAVIDIGSSAIKFAIYAKRGESLQLEFEADPVGTALGRGLVPGAQLDARAAGSTIEALGVFAGIAAARGAPITLVLATEAIRQCRDREFFLQSVRAVVGPEAVVRCIDAETEGRWSHASARHGLGGLSPGTLVVDPGGSSCDFSQETEAGASPRTLSLPFGMNRLMAMAPPERDEGRVSPTEIAGLGDFLRQAWSALRPWLTAAPPPTELVGTSGAAIALAAAVIGFERPERDARIRAVHGKRIASVAIRDLIADLAPMSAAERRRRHPSLGVTRSAIMVQGALSYATLLEELGLQELRVNGYGAKLGGLLDQLGAQ